jgi:hypothetical protein
MSRSRLQIVTLLVWLAGFLCLELVILAGYLNGVDSYRLDDRFIGYDVRQRLEALVPPDQAVRLGSRLRQRLDDKGTPRTGRELKRICDELLQGAVPDADRSAVGDWVVHRSAQGLMGKMASGVFQVYLPWLTLMLGATLARQRKEEIERARARLVLGISAALQVAGLALLGGTLSFGDLGGSIDPQLAAVAVAAFVGTLVHFVYPTRDAPSSGSEEARPVP